MQEQDEMITMIEDSARRFLEDHSAATEQSDSDIWAAIAEMGWLGLALPEARGGAALGIAEVCALTRLFGQFALPTPYISQCVLPSFLLSRCDDSLANSLIDDLCEGIASGAQRVSLAWQETLRELNSSAVNCQLNNGKLSGQKCFVAGATPATGFLVSCKIDDELAIVYVANDANGVSLTNPIESQLQFASVNFDQVDLGKDAILLRGSLASQALEQTLQAATIALAAELEGSASGCLDKTLEYIKTRKQFKQIIGSFQSIRHRSVDLLIALRLAESSWRRAVAESSEQQSNEPFLPQAHAAKARCADTALKVAKESIQMHGAMGFTEEAGIGNYMRTAISLSAWLGSARHHRNALMRATTTAELFND